MVQHIKRQREPIHQSTSMARADHAGRVWGGSPKTEGVRPHTLPKTHPKYRPLAGTQRFSNGPSEKKQGKLYKGDKRPPNDISDEQRRKQLNLVLSRKYARQRAQAKRSGNLKGTLTGVSYVPPGCYINAKGKVIKP